MKTQENSKNFSTIRHKVGKFVEILETKEEEEDSKFTIVIGNIALSEEFNTINKARYYMKTNAIDIAVMISTIYADQAFRNRK